MFRVPISNSFDFTKTTTRRDPLQPIRHLHDELCAPENRAFPSAIHNARDSLDYPVRNLTIHHTPHLVSGAPQLIMSDGYQEEDVHLSKVQNHDAGLEDSAADAPNEGNGG